MKARCGLEIVGLTRRRKSFLLSGISAHSTFFLLAEADEMSPRSDG